MHLPQPINIATVSSEQLYGMNSTGSTPTGSSQSLLHPISEHVPSSLSSSWKEIPSQSVPLSSLTAVNANSLRMPTLSRAVSLSGNMESRRQTLAEMVSQIRKYDPYPCILGIPVMPALFLTCKFYIFVCFLLIGTRTMVSCLKILRYGN